MVGCIDSFIPKIAKTVPSPLEGANYIMGNPYACGVKVEEYLDGLFLKNIADRREYILKMETIHKLINEKQKQTKLSSMIDRLFSE